MNSPTGNETRPDPPRDSQFWFGWAAAILVVLILVAVVVLAWRQLTPPAENRAEVAMTPIVGGMTLVTATPTSEGAVVRSVSATQMVAAGDAATVTTTKAMTATPAAATAIAVEVTATATVTQVLETPTAASAPQEPTAAPTPTVTVAPTATARPSPTTTPTPAPTPTPVAAIRVAFTPGDLVADDSGPLTVYANAAADAPALDSYGAGMLLTVLEPSSDYTGYPVIADGHGWVRVRAADGLVGWVMTDTLVRQP